MPRDAENTRTTAPRNERDQGHITDLYTNARSLKPQLYEFFIRIATEKPNVTAITETWANSNQLMREFSVMGYKSFHKTKNKKKEKLSITFATRLIPLKENNKIKKTNMTPFMWKFQ